MSEHAYHQSLRLQNFTAFSDASFEFVPGINVFIGENGTGKTHAMKAMYAWQLIQHKGTDEPGLSIVRETFQIAETHDVVRSKKGERGQCEVSGGFSGFKWRMTPQAAGTLTSRGSFREMPRPVFIPAIDMMGHTRGFVSTYDLYRIDFDLTHREIVSLLLAPEHREKDVESLKLSAIFENVLKGKIELEGERFYLHTQDLRFPMPAVAEGLRKIATLLRLVQGGWLKPGATLFWDEPEVNLNPVLMDEVVGALLTLARSGVQVFLATHSYVILKEFDLQSREDEVRYFAFASSEEGTTVAHNSDFALLDPNPILDQYDRMFVRDLQQTVEGRER